MEKVKVTTWEEYRTAAMRTCTDECYNKGYMLLGLVGEAGEVANKVKKIIRDDGGRLTHERSQQILGELGDVMWYVAGLATVTETTPDDCAEYPDFAELQKYIEEPANMICEGNISGRAVTLAYDAANMAAAIYSDQYDCADLSLVIEAVAAMGRHIGHNIRQICQHNIDKLTDRYNRNMIGGSGDER